MPHTEHKTTEAEIKEVWERLTASEASIKSAHHRIDGLQEMSTNIKDLVVVTAQLATEMKALREDSEKTEKRLETLESKPAKRYETFVTACLTALAGGIAGYLLGFILQ